MHFDILMTYLDFLENSKTFWELHHILKCSVFEVFDFEFPNIFLAEKNQSQILSISEYNGIAGDMSYDTSFNLNISLIIS